MIKEIRKQLHAISELKAMSNFKAVFETIDGIVFGCSEVTIGAPHIVDNLEIKRFMTMAIIALLPSVFSAIYFFGWPVIFIILASYISGGTVELAFALIRKREIEEGFLVTGLIFPLILPPTVPLWIVVVGSVFGVFFGKEVFGGTGRNIFNPALVGRLFITIAFPQIMSSSWRAPFSDAITSATPLSIYKTGGEMTPIMDLMLGLHAGSMGELFRIGIIAGGVFLMITKVANWRIPISFIGSLALFSFLGNTFFPENVAPPLFQIFSGGLLFGAMFMVTDPVTSPSTTAGKFIFGITCGLLTVLIRSFSGYTEGVMFTIILMNSATPLLDHIVLQFKYRESVV